MGEAKRCREVRESRMVKIKFSGAVFTHFFEVHKRAFAINKGLPEGSELVDIQFDVVTKDGEAVFRHKDFMPVPDGGDPPYMDVQYTAYEFLEEVKPEAKPGLSSFMPFTRVGTGVTFKPKLRSSK